MSDRRNRIIIFALGFCILCVLIGLGWADYHFASYKLGGEDFGVNWVATRLLVISGISPYSQSVRQEILALAEEYAFFREVNSLRKTSPIYDLVFIFPFALIDNFTLARTMWILTQQVALVAFVLSAIRVTRWQPGWLTFSFVFLYVVFCYHHIMSLVSGGMEVWVALLIPLIFISIRAGRDELAGVLLALITIQPFLVFFFVLFTLIWAVSQRRRLLLFWFLGGVGLLSIVGVILAPDWPLQYLRIIWRYSEYFNYMGTPTEAFREWWPGLGVQMGWVLTAILLIILLTEWWQARGKEFRWFLWTACLTLVISQWVGIPTESKNFVVLTTPLILVFAVWQERWGKGGRWVTVVGIIVLFIWEWFLVWRNLQGVQFQQQLNLLFPVPLFLLIGLYWVRWWAIRPSRLFLEEVRSYEET